jgi:CubicO group peptidase (beta-lactamase class C family)
MAPHTESVFPAATWRTALPEEVGLDADRLQALQRWYAEAAQERPYRLLVVRHGRLVAEWQQGLGADAQRNLASAAKSVYSSVLGIAIAEGRLPSADARVIDYYPEMMDVPEGHGPKEGRYAYPKDRDITFRQLISNTSGYMKPGEMPGQVFNYQTFGMNIVTHALGTIDGVYDTRNPGDTPGFGQLIDRTIREPIGATWGLAYSNFEYQPGAPAAIFGNYCSILATARDMARLGLLWARRGRWGDRQVVPEGWLRSATRTAPAVLEHCPPDTWSYGYAFWTNDHGLLWPNLPREAFAASGAGSQLIWVCPGLDLVVVQGPGIYAQHQDDVCRHVLGEVMGAVRS